MRVANAMKAPSNLRPDKLLQRWQSRRFGCGIPCQNKRSCRGHVTRLEQKLEGLRRALKLIDDHLLPFTQTTELPWNAALSKTIRRRVESLEVQHYGLLFLNAGYTRVSSSGVAVGLLALHHNLSEEQHVFRMHDGVTLDDQHLPRVLWRPERLNDLFP
eukprot:CAMPEP_0184386036 /NCGR_PEP_ID=MMETSP0007-20130409/9405_1 /TAXON_ID=97485 /ORGANISM="Prymnesium parvum, Strain Texoma1" /LENGTH=158 /DNA_ID=CAMNT_0026733701 /DNA_START=474 /DNA_END=950 /DNA_ORIENTATION=-